MENNPDRFSVIARSRKQVARPHASRARCDPPISARRSPSSRHLAPINAQSPLFYSIYILIIRYLMPTQEASKTLITSLQFAICLNELSDITTRHGLNEKTFILTDTSATCCTPRTQTIYRDRRRLASNSRYSRTIPRSFTEVEIGAPDSLSSPSKGPLIS
ncbi:hypothetical protein EVAR_96548_1 [Eumeta japonica]|uniref:Uncharacterized protein n=1 Tax=Eumeta variegata TaxID=151549 RepID=A0A4C1WED9_EUMVA|nr:hypothetical protein EVAR_96548_1 [Eumeta japonica]